MPEEFELGTTSRDPDPDDSPEALPGDPPKRPRRGPLSLDERLTALIAQKMKQLERVREREAAQEGELAKLRTLRESIEHELARLGGAASSPLPES